MRLFMKTHTTIASLMKFQLLQSKIKKKIVPKNLLFHTKTIKMKLLQLIKIILWELTNRDLGMKYLIAKMPNSCLRKGVKVTTYQQAEISIWKQTASSTIRKRIRKVYMVARISNNQDMSAGPNTIWPLTQDMLKASSQ